MNVCFLQIFHIATKDLVDSFMVALVDHFAEFCGVLKLVGELFPFDPH
jgi:hypothetical protein